MLVVYVSGHGFGHATRVGEVLRVLREREPKLPIAVVTASPESLYRTAVPGSFDFRAVECDPGLVQRSAIVIDESASAQKWRAFHARYGDLVDAERRWLRHAGARLILGDVPPLAFDAAAEAGIPSVGLANFSWDWIYRHLASREPLFQEAASAAAAAYRKARLLLRLPFAGDLSAFPSPVDIPLVARHPRVSRHEARRRLGLGAGKVVLVSFGGLGLPGFDAGVLAPLDEFEFLTVGEDDGLPANVRSVTAADIPSLGLRYEDLVGASDVVVTKPGYGIVSDAIGARSRIVYTDRGDFPEYPILVREMSRYLPCVHVSNEDLLAGRLGDALREVLALPIPAAPDTSGAAVAAARILENLS